MTIFIILHINKYDGQPKQRTFMPRLALTFLAVLTHLNLASNKRDIGKKV